MREGNDKQALWKDQGKKKLEFPEFLGNSAVHERNLLEKGHARTGRCPVSLERTLKNFG
jgi:hypothetical protein